FFSDADRTAMQIIRETLPQNLPALDLTFNDKRVLPLLFRYRARNFPATLTDDEQRRWQLHRQAALTPERVQTYIHQLEELYNRHEENPEKLAQLKELYEYAKQLVG
ncbi:MAG: exodeoxyribonuclease I, partial [Enterobacterales bacterium]|nr:exodeoxyribonuclease I [Enterobacterales bacterium]